MKSMRFSSGLEIAEEMRRMVRYGYSQADLARDIGEGRSFICEVLQGKKMPSAKCRAFLGYSQTAFYQKSAETRTGRDSSGPTVELVRFESDAAANN